MAKPKFHVLVVSYALRGHANACLAVAWELARRGHRVSFAMPAEGRAWVEEIGVEYQPWEPKLPDGQRLTARQLDARRAASRQQHWNRAQWLVVRSMKESYAPVFSSARQLFDAVRPDLVLTTQVAVPVMDAAMAAGIPLAIQAVYVPGVARDHSVGVRFSSPDRLPWPRRIERDYWGLRLMWAEGRHQRTRRRCSSCLTQAELFRRNTVLASTAACVEPEGAFPPNIYLLGPLLRPPASLPAELAKWLGKQLGKGVVLVAFGSLVELSARQITALAEALGRCGRPVLWALPKAQQGGLHRPPASVRIEAFVPQTAVLAHPATRCFVTHAGGNSFLEAMYWGRPVLAIPFMLDQPYFASRTVELGVGIRIAPSAISPQNIREGLGRLASDPGFTAAAQRLSQRLQQTPGAAGAADVLERMLADSAARSAIRHEFSPG